jgi:hypothetical protein
VDYTRRGKRKRRKDWVIFNRDDFRCVYCGKSSIEDGVKLEADHVIARSAGGLDTAGNLVTSCRTCNRSKFDGELITDTAERLLTLTSERNRARRISDQLPVDLGRSPQETVKAQDGGSGAAPSAVAPVSSDTGSEEPVDSGSGVTTATETGAGADA